MKNRNRSMRVQLALRPPTARECEVGFDTDEGQWFAMEPGTDEGEWFDTQQEALDAWHAMRETYDVSANNESGVLDDR